MKFSFLFGVMYLENRKMFHFLLRQLAVPKIGGNGFCGGIDLLRHQPSIASLCAAVSSHGQRLAVAALLCTVLAACDAAQQRQVSTTMDPLLRAVCEASMRSPGPRGRVSAEDRRLCANLSSTVTNASVLIGGTIAQALSPKEREKADETTKRVLDGPPRPGTRETWSSPDTPGNGGSTELVRVEQGGTCRVIREVAYIPSQGGEILQESRLCQDASGRWTRVA
jgi:surface antigen